MLVVVVNFYRYVRYHIFLAVKQGWTNLFCYRRMKFSTMDYEQYWENNCSQGRENDIRFQVFSQLIEENSKVIEIGCGDGMLLQILKKRKSIVAKGYDISSNAIQKAKSKGLDAEVRDVSVIGLNEVADYLVIADCLEHLAMPEVLLSQLRRKFLKTLLLSVPNSCYWRYHFRVLFGKFMVQWVAHPGEHLRFWSITDM